MSVEVDKAGRYGQAVGIDDPLRAAVDAAGFDDPAVLHSDVAKIRRQPAAVRNPSAFDQNIVRHVRSSLSCRLIQELTEMSSRLSTKAGLVSVPDRAMCGSRSISIEVHVYGDSSRRTEESR